jgi:hypothetical protein
VLDPLVQTLNQMLTQADPINWMGGMGGISGAGVSPTAWRNLAPEAKAALNTLLETSLRDPGKMLGEFTKRPFRTVGIERKAGRLDPQQYIDLVKQIPGYEKFIGKTRGLVERTLGPEFDVYRGQAATDPLFQLPLTQQKLPSATAASLAPEWAKQFAEWSLMKPETTAHIAKMKATPQAVESLLPTRLAPHAAEQEMIINPQKLKDIQLQAGMKIDPSQSITGPVMTPPSGMLQSILDQILRSLGQGTR